MVRINSARAGDADYPDEVESVLLFILGVFIVVVGILLSIALHELGHLIPAKLFGVKVTQYMIGFGRTLFSVRRGDTEYGVKAIPLGGYIAMIGMYPPAGQGGRARNASTGFFNSLVQDARSSSAESVGEGEEDRTFYRLPVWKRIIVMLGGPFMNLVIGVVLFAVLLCGFGAQLTNIASVSECVVPATSSRQTCEPTDPVAPAAVAGFTPGDRILSIDGTPIDSWSASSAIFRKSAGKQLSVVVDRDGSPTTLTVTPMRAERPAIDADGKVVLDASGEPVMDEVGFIGIGAGTELVPQPITEVLPAVGAQISAVTGVVIHLPQRMVDVWNAAFSTAPRDPNGPMSLVGVGRLAGEYTSMEQVPVVAKAYNLIGLVAAVNIALMVFNLIPLLPLDGGHIAGALWEAIRRFFARVFRKRDPGPVDTAKLMPLTFGVVVVLGAMTVVLTYADIVKPVNPF